MFNWNDLTPRFEDEAENCYNPAYPVDLTRYPHDTDIALVIEKNTNDQYLPNGFNYITLIRIIYIDLYANLGFEYRIQLLLAQTNCSHSPNPQDQDQVCEPQPHTPSVAPNL